MPRDDPCNCNSVTRRMYPYLIARLFGETSYIKHSLALDQLASLDNTNTNDEQQITVSLNENRGVSQISLYQ